MQQRGTLSPGLGCLKESGCLMKDCYPLAIASGGKGQLLKGTGRFIQGKPIYYIQLKINFMHFWEKLGYRLSRSHYSSRRRGRIYFIRCYRWSGGFIGDWWAIATCLLLKRSCGFFRWSVLSSMLLSGKCWDLCSGLRAGFCSLRSRTYPSSVDRDILSFRK